MRFSYSAIIALLAGSLSLIMLIYYYSIEKDFQRNFKLISAEFSTLQKQREDISYGVLQSALFAYHNQDLLAKDRNKIKQSIKSLLQQPALQQNEHYRPLKNTLGYITSEIDEYIELIEYYLMINAGIKNSMVFLSTQELQAHNYFEVGSQPVKHIHKVVDNIMQAKRMLDKTYIKQLSTYIEQLEDKPYTLEQKAYVQSLLIHVRFLELQYPLYLDTFSMIMNSSLRTHLEQAQLQFEMLAKEDFRYLNTLATSLFLLIFLALMTITVLLFRLQTENTKLVRLHHRLNFTLQHDALTGLLNRRRYEDRVSELTQPSVLLINISRFKLINDFYGSDYGDALLKKTSSLLTQKFDKESGTCYRVGGDEFAIVFDKINVRAVEIIAHEVNELLTSRTYEISDVRQNIHINMAISHEKPLLETADMALKQLKLKPTGNLLNYSSTLDMREHIQSNIEVTQIIHDALNDNRIIPYYQPIIDLKTREIVKYEALVRLKLKDGQILSPIQFLPVAQQTPFYYEITRVMVSKTIAYFSDKPYRFSINFSMSDLEDDEIIDTLRKHFTDYPDVAARMDIELLESEQLTNIKKVKNFISELKKFGCGISVDDFGSGYSNFTNLTEFELDSVKIDGSLIKELAHSDEHFKTVRAIMGLINEMGIESIAEFVQDEKSAQMLTELGVTHAQGYYFGKPDEFIVNV